MARRHHNAPLLDRPDAGRRPTMAHAAALAHLDEHQGAIARAHDQVNFSATPPRRPIIALQQAQTGLLQMAQCQVLCRIASLLAGLRTLRGPRKRKNH